MPRVTPSWTTKDGQIHKDYIESLRHEIYLWMAKKLENVTLARRFALELSGESIGEFMDLLEELEGELNEPTTFEVIETGSRLPDSLTTARAVPAEIKDSRFRWFDRDNTKLKLVGNTGS